MRSAGWLALLLAALLAAPAAAQSPLWRLEQPDPPPGAPFRVALGTPGDLQFWAPNRGLLGVEGNAVVPRGILYYDGASWRMLSTVCGGPGDTMRIAWAGPTEFWTVSEPSRPRQGSGLALCHFRDGQVVASYGTAETSPDPFRQMNAAACRAPNDCWFGGVGSESPSGERVGAFHLHWDGSSLRTVYAPQGRGVTDIEPLGDGYAESVVVGRRREDRSGEPPDLAVPEAEPALLHRIARNGTFAGDPFVPAAAADEGSELLALDSAGANLWAGGGGAASGAAAAADPDGVIERPPLAARLVSGQFREVPLAGTFGAADRIEDIAAVPGTGDAWGALVPFAERDRTNVKALAVKIVGATGATEVAALPASGAGRGAAARIAFLSPTDGWLVTNAGWLFHYTDGTRPPRDTDPAFANLITFRPNEAAEQFVPDAPPVDDSQLFAPPPVAVEPAPAPQQQQTQRLPALMKNISSSRRGLTITVRFTLVRKARVQLIARRKGKTVARTRARVMNPGRRRLSLRLSRKRWPTALRFRTKELTLGDQGGGDGGSGDDGDTVTTPGG